MSSEYSGNGKVYMGNGTGLSISHIGSSNFHPNLSSRSFILNKLLHVPLITKNLLSVSTFARDNNIYFEFHPSFCLMKDQVTQVVLLRGVLHEGLYKFDLGSPISSSTPRASCLTSTVSTAPLNRLSSSLHSNQVSSDLINHWHNRLGHPSPSIVKQVLMSCNILIPRNETLDFCSSCALGKSHHLPFPLSQSIVSIPLHLIYTDV